MRERTEQILRIVCLVLAALFLYQAVQVLLRANPLWRVTIPALPTLASEGNTPATAGGRDISGPSAAAPGKGTNDVRVESGTNFVVGGKALKPETNPVSSQAPDQAATNGIGLPASNETKEKFIAHGEVKQASTNREKISKSKIEGANSAAPFGMASAGMNGGPPGTRGGGATELPPAIKARVDRIYESEMLGPVMHPLPMALMGIAGNTAFLRSPGGQTGLVKEGDSLGEIKLLRIGVNRVLVEQGGQKKELTIFQGYGGQSLLPKEN